MTAPTRVLVPVAPTTTLADTVAYAVDNATPESGTIHLVRTAPHRHVTGEPSTDRHLLARAERTAHEVDADVPVTTAVLGADRYLADPVDHLAVLEAYADEHSIDRAIIDPNYAVNATAADLHAIEERLDDSAMAIERAPVSAGRWGLTRSETVRAGAVFALAFGFYLAISDYGVVFTLATGAATAILAGAVLRNVTFETTPAPLKAALTVGRGLLFLPVLLWEIGKANAQFAFVVLHPSLPIDPRVDRLDAAVGDGLSVTAFANSLTLTPGTLTVDATGSELYVHSLTPDTREDLLDGRRERLIRFVFYGREAIDIAGPRARNDTELVDGPDPPSPSAGHETRSAETTGSEP